MTLDNAFKVVLDMAQDLERDCLYDPLFKDGMGPETLTEMKDAIKIVSDFING